MDTSLGQIAFEAYSVSTGGKTYDGKDIPPYSELTLAVQVAWEAAAQAVANEVLTNLNPPQAPAGIGVTGPG